MHVSHFPVCQSLPRTKLTGSRAQEACSGSAFGGYMGVSLAWPQAQLSLEEIQAKKIGETVDWPQQKRNVQSCD